MNTSARVAISIISTACPKTFSLSLLRIRLSLSLVLLVRAELSPFKIYPPFCRMPYTLRYCVSFRPLDPLPPLQIALRIPMYEGAPLHVEQDGRAEEGGEG
jgi:hypothetical protein